MGSGGRVVLHRRVARLARKESKMSRLRDIREGVRNSVRRPSGVRMAINIDGVMVPAYTVGVVASVLGKNVATIVNWESSGTIAETPYRGPGGARLYTIDMIEALKRRLWLEGRIDLHNSQPSPFAKYWVKNVEFGDGRVELVRLYGVGALGAAVDRSAHRMRLYERLGKVPRTPLVDQGSRRRLYTIEMIEAVVDAFEVRGGDPRGKYDWQAVLGDIHEAWRELGVWKAKVLNESPGRGRRTEVERDKSAE